MMPISLPSPLARLLRRGETIALAVACAGAVGALASFANASPAVPQAPTLDRSIEQPRPPAAEPLLVRPLALSDAAAANAAIPVVGGNVPARPFHGGTNNANALDCLTSAIYYEAGSEPLDGQRAVAQVVVNRVRHPAFPNSICGVVYQGSELATGCQFTFTCDGSLARVPLRATWDRARQVAAAALAGAVYGPVGTATHYHTYWVVPYWSASLVKSAVVGDHIFYRWSGGWGRPAAFTQRYSGSEPNSTALRTAAAAASANRPAEPALAASMAKDPLLRLVERQPTSDGHSRVTLRIGSSRRAEVSIPEAPAYVERVAASDNLRWSLSGGDSEQPLGRKVEATAAAAP